MELKLDRTKKTSTKASTLDTGNATQAIAPAQRVQKDTSLNVKSKSLIVKRICVLRCNTVMLQNFTEDLNEPGRQLMLVREPDNRYDRWAIKVCTLSGTMLGYLPSLKNQSVARLMDAEKNITAFVDNPVSVQPSYQPTDENTSLPLALFMDIATPKEDQT